MHSTAEPARTIRSSSRAHRGQSASRPAQAIIVDDQRQEVPDPADAHRLTAASARPGSLDDAPRLSSTLRPPRKSEPTVSGRKYDPQDKHPLDKGTGDPVKAQSAQIFFDAWKKAEAKPAYARMEAEWKGKYG